MSGYLIDTDICIFYLQGKYGINDKIKEVGISNCFVSEITVAELTYGAQKSANYSKHIKDVQKVERLFTISLTIALQSMQKRESGLKN